MQGQSLSRAFQDMSSRFDSQRRSADGELRADVAQLNALANQLGDVNRQIAETDANNAQGLYDQQSAVIKAMSKLADINVVNHENGVVDVTIGNGRALVIGRDPYAISISSNGAGYAQLFTDGAAVTTDVTGEISGGRIGGLLSVRDQMIPAYSSKLDALAYKVATDVNSLSTGGFDLNGNPGVAFFAPLATQAGAASAIAVNSTVAANNSLIVTTSTTAPGGNDVATAIGRLQESPMTGSTLNPIEGWGELVYTVGTDSAGAQQAQKSHEQVAQQLDNLWDQMSGVSIDEEAAMLMRFQTAYQANAKFFQAVDDTLQLLMQLGS